MGSHTGRVVLLSLIIVGCFILQIGLFSSWGNAPIEPDEYIDYDESIFDFYEKPEAEEEKNAWWGLFGLAGIFYEYGETIVGGLTFLWKLLTFDVPQLPEFLRVIFTTLFWIAIGVTLVMVLRGVN